MGPLIGPHAASPVAFPRPLSDSKAAGPHENRRLCLHTLAVTALVRANTDASGVEASKFAILRQRD